MKTTRSRSGTKGQALVHLLVGIAIVSIFVQAITAMVYNAHQESRSIAEKLAALDLEKVLESALGDGSVCRYVLNNPNPLTFNSQSLPQTITLPSPGGGTKPALYAAIAGSTPGPVIARVDDPVSPLAPSVRVSSIQMQITQGSQGIYFGNWLVNFDSTGLLRGIRPATVAVRLTVDETDPTQARVTDCSGGNGQPAGVTSYKMYWDQTNACRTSPSIFTKSVTADLTSLGDFGLWDANYGSVLLEMNLRAATATTATQFLRHVNSQVTFWLNGVKIAEELSPGLKARTITWNLIKGENVIQIVGNACSGGYGSLVLMGDFFVRYPQLQFIR